MWHIWNCEFALWASETPPKCKLCHIVTAVTGHQKKKLSSETREESSGYMTDKWMMIPAQITLFRSMDLLPFESSGLMELMNTWLLDYEAYILEEQSAAPELILNIINCESAGSDRWSCVWEHVTLRLFPLDVIHFDKSGIESGFCHNGKGTCTASTPFKSLYPLPRTDDKEKETKAVKEILH